MALQGETRHLVNSMVKARLLCLPKISSFSVRRINNPSTTMARRKNAPTLVSSFMGVPESGYQEWMGNLVLASLGGRRIREERAVRVAF